MRESLKPLSDSECDNHNFGGLSENVAADKRERERKSNSSGGQEIVQPERIRTFAEARQATFFPDDEFLVGYLTEIDSLAMTPYRYATTAPLGSRDEKYLTNLERFKLHLDFVDFITSCIEFYSYTKHDGKQAAKRRRRYLNQLRDNCLPMLQQVMKHGMDQRSLRSDLDRFSGRAWSQGLALAGLIGNKRQWKEDLILAADTNMRFQPFAKSADHLDSPPDYVHYCTDYHRYGYRRQHSRSRIYLNPEIGNQVAVFRDLIGRIEDRGLYFLGKISTRDNELERAIVQASRNVGDFNMVSPPRLRTDSILIVSNENQADEVLQTVLEYARENSGAFVDQPVPKLAFKIAPGVALAAEIDGGKISFNQHRVRLLEVARERTQNSFGLVFNDKRQITDQVLGYFKDEIKAAVKHYNANPHNLAF